MDPIFWTIVGVVLVGVTGAVIYSHYQEKARTEKLRQMAGELGFEFAAEDARLVTEWLAGFHLGGHGHSKKARNVLRAETPALRLTLFEYHYTTGHGKHQQRHSQVVAAFDFDEPMLPKFELRPEGFFHQIGKLFGYQDINFDDHPKFSKLYLLRGPDEAAVRELFTPDVRELFEVMPGWSVEGHGGRLLAYRADQRPAPEKWREFMDEAYGIAGAFRDKPAGESSGLST